MQAMHALNPKGALLKIKKRAEDEDQTRDP